jgi:hypothetical protein
MRSVEPGRTWSARRARGVRALALAGVVLAGGCGHHGFTATRANMVGRYVFASADPGLRHGEDTLTLRGDGTYLLQRVVHRHSAAALAGRWSFVKRPEPEVLLDSVGYPVHVSGQTVRLLVDLDLGYAFVKQ